jgi:hypothetical protein
MFSAIAIIEIKACGRAVETTSLDALDYLISSMSAAHARF